MKQSLLRILLVLAGFAGLSIPAKAQQVDQVLVKVPFSFVAAGQTLPAGEYRITRLRDEEPRILLLTNVESRANLVLLRPDSQDDLHGKVQLAFATVDDKHYLSRIETADHTYGFAVPAADTLLAATPQKGAMASSASGSN